MTYRRRGFARATIGGPGAVVLQQQLGKGARQVLEAYAGRMATAEDPVARETAAGLLEFLGELDDAAGSWRSRRAEDRGDERAAGFADESAEAVDLDERPASELLRGGIAEAVAGLTVRQVADRLGRSTVWIRLLCRRGEDADGLSATKRGATWVIDPRSVEAHELANRSPAA